MHVYTCINFSRQRKRERRYFVLTEVRYGLWRGQNGAGPPIGVCTLGEKSLMG